MSDELEQFEKLLESQSLRQVPAEWRNEILAATAQAQSVHNLQPVTGRSFLSMLNHRLASLLWPHPVAWAGLAAVWILLLAAHFSMSDDAPAIAEKTLPPSPEVVAELNQQKQLLAELMGASDAREADQQKTFVPKPRSEATEMMTA
jgi:hypothetical protein